MVRAALLAVVLASLEKGGLVTVPVKDDALASAYAARRLALVIGISEFQDPGWRGLRYPRKDAADLAGALRDPERGHFDDVDVATEEPRTTRAGVLDAVRTLARRASRPDDVVVIYVSAHGTLARDGRGELRRYLVTSDASYRDISGTALPIDELKSEFDKLSSRRRLLVLATCHSGSGKSLLPPELERELGGIKAGFYARPLEEASRATMVFAACDWGETAREDETLQNDIYTHFLVAGLSGAADRNVDGAVTATEAHDFARRRTWAFTGGRQRPSAEILEVGADPVVLSGQLRRQGHPELFSYSPRLDGFALKVDGEDRAELPGGAAVPAGKHKVQLTKGGHSLLDRDLEIRQGERVDLELLLAAEQPHRTVAIAAGMAGFLNRRTRAEVLGEFPAVGLQARYDDLLLPRVSLGVDLSGATGTQELRLGGAPIPFRYAALVLGTTAAYTWRFGGLSLFAGPRVAGLWVARSFNLDALQMTQSYITVSPGLMGGFAYALTDRLELSAQANVAFTFVLIDGAGGLQGFAGGSAAVGYRF